MFKFLRNFLFLFLVSPVAFAAQFHVGNFTLNGSTGNQVIHATTFQPKLVMFFGANNTGDGNLTNAANVFGAAASSSERWSMSLFAADAQAANTADRRFTSSSCYSSVDSAGAALHEFDFVSFNPDGFTINVTTSASTRIVGFIAIGGPDFSAKVGTFDGPASAATSTVSGLGFKSSVVILGNTQSNITEGSALSYIYMLGAAVSSSSRWVIQTIGLEATEPTQENRYWSTTEIVHRQSDGGNSQVANFVSHNDNGFSISFTTTSTSMRYGYIALGGISAQTGTFAQPGAASTQEISGLNFHPRLLLFGSTSTTSASGTYEAHSRMAIGAGASASLMFATSYGSSDAVSTSVADRRSVNSQVITHLTEGTPTVNAEADLLSTRAGAFNLNWSTADASARNEVYLALGDVKNGSGVIVN